MKQTIAFNIRRGWSLQFADWVDSEIRKQGLKSFHKKAGISRIQLYRIRKKPTDSATIKLIHRVVSSLGYELQLNILDNHE